MPGDVLLIVLSLSAQAVYALDKPSAESLTEQLTAVIPPYWSVTKTTITASVNSGDAVNPVIKQRFQAIVTPKSKLFAEDPGSAEAFAPYIPIVPTLDTKETRTLYGIAQSTYSAGHWDTKLHLENSVSEIGKPKSLFSGPTLVRGSERESKMRVLLAADIAKKIQRQAQSEIEAQKASDQSQLRALKASQAEAIDQIKANYAATKNQLEQQQQELKTKQHIADTGEQQLQTEINAQNAKHAAKMGQLEAAQAKTINTLKANQAAEKRTHQQQLESLKATNQAELDRAKQHHQDKFKALKVAQQAEIERAKQAHQAALGELQAEHESEFASLKQKHDAALDLLKQRNQQEFESINTKYNHKVKVLQQEIEKISKLVALQKKKNQEEEQLAGVQKKALEQRAQHNQKLLVQFRKAIAADDADARRAAFAAALTSDNALLRRTAIKEGFKNDDSVLRATAIRLGLQSKDTTTQRSAIEAGFTSKNENQRSAALEAALNSKDSIAQHMALNKIFSTRKVVSGSFEIGENGEVSEPFVIEISNFNQTTGKLSANISDSKACYQSSAVTLTGALAGTNLTLRADRYCTLGFTLSGSREMTGAVVNTSNNRRYKTYKAVLNLVK